MGTSKCGRFGRSGIPVRPPPQNICDINPYLCRMTPANIKSVEPCRGKLVYEVSPRMRNLSMPNVMGTGMKYSSDGPQMGKRESGISEPGYEEHKAKRRNWFSRRNKNRSTSLNTRQEVDMVRAEDKKSERVHLLRERKQRAELVRSCGRRLLLTPCPSAGSCSDESEGGEPVNYYISCNCCQSRTCQYKSQKRNRSCQRGFQYQHGQRDCRCDNGRRLPDLIQKACLCSQDGETAQGNNSPCNTPCCVNCKTRPESLTGRHLDGTTHNPTEKRQRMLIPSISIFGSNQEMNDPAKNHADCEQIGHNIQTPPPRLGESRPVQLYPQNYEELQANRCPSGLRQPSDYVLPTPMKSPDSSIQNERSLEQIGESGNFVSNTPSCSRTGQEGVGQTRLYQQKPEVESCRIWGIKGSTANVAREPSAAPVNPKKGHIFIPRNVLENVPKNQDLCCSLTFNESCGHCLCLNSEPDQQCPAARQTNMLQDEPAREHSFNKLNSINAMQTSKPTPSALEAISVQDSKTLIRQQYSKQYPKIESDIKRSSPVILKQKFYQSEELDKPPVPTNLTKRKTQPEWNLRFDLNYESELLEAMNRVTRLHLKRKKINAEKRGAEDRSISTTTHEGVTTVQEIRQLAKQIKLLRNDMKQNCLVDFNIPDNKIFHP